MKSFKPSASYIRVAAATPRVYIADVKKNLIEITRLFRVSAKQDVAVVVFPELSITGYSIGDLVQSPALLLAAKEGLLTLASESRIKNTAMVVGLPLTIGNGLFNCAVLIARGKILGIIPKQNLPTYKEFYEKRWYQAWDKKITVDVNIGDQIVPCGQPLFAINQAVIGIEVCEDLWVANQPSIGLAARGANIICNPSASPESVTKADYRRELVHNTAGRLVAGYIYAGADPSESTMDTVMGGHALISEAGKMLAERNPFDDSAARLTIADIDVEHLVADRRRDTNYPVEPSVVIETGIRNSQTTLLHTPAKHPFIPSSDARLEEVFTIQTFGLKKRVEASRAKKIVLGLSGGLDSTLALLVAVRTAELLGVKPSDIILTLTMPGEASSKRTQNNAILLATALKIQNRKIPIAALSTAQLKAIGHDTVKQDTTYENTQARIRTALLFNTANSESGIVLGTGDLSEIALGWCTFNGDHMSGYNVNASIPKTLVKHLVCYAASKLDNKKARTILLDILDTPISPELTRTSGRAISQKTEELIGPYELHDFFLYHFVRWQTPADKILFLAERAFKGDYSSEAIECWLKVFHQRFISSQWKRSVMPDGPKVGSISLSPRGDWRMPSDIDATTHMIS